MGQFNSGYRRPDFSGSQNFGVPSNSSLAPVPASQPKSKTKLLIVVIAAAVILISIFATISNHSKKNNETDLDSQFRADLYELKWQYDIFFEDYEQKIGFTPELKYVSESAIFPNGNYNALKEEYDSLIEYSERITEFDPKNDQEIIELQKMIKEKLPNYSDNILFMQQFYDAMSESVDQSIEKGVCISSDSFNKLNSKEDYAKILQIIRTLYCERVEFILNKEELMEKSEPEDQIMKKELLNLLEERIRPLNKEEYSAIKNKADEILSRGEENDL